MKSFVRLGIYLVLVLASASACFTPAFYIEGTGSTKSADFPLQDFTSLSVSSQFKVIIEASSSFQVKLTVDENLINYVRAEVQDKTLNIYTEGVLNIKNAILEARIKMPAIEKLSLSGMAIVKIAKGFDLSNNLDINISGMSKLQCLCRAQDMDLKISGSSFAEFTGTGRNLYAQLSGASKIDMRKMAFQNINIDCSGMSRAYVFLQGELYAKASGHSRIFYSGIVEHPDFETSGDSIIEKM